MAVLALSGAACGGADEATPAADRAAARKAVLKAADFPSGWKSNPHEKLPGEDELVAEVAKCLGIPPPSTRATAVVRSPDFSSGFATTASSVITFVETDDRAAADAAAFAGEKFPSCVEPGMAEQVRDVAPEGASVDGVKIVKRSFPSLGDRTAAYRFSATLHIGEIPVTVNIDLVHVFKDRAEVSLTFVSPGQPFPEDLARSLAAKVVARL